MAVLLASEIPYVDRICNHQLHKIHCEQFDVINSARPRVAEALQSGAKIYLKNSQSTSDFFQNGEKTMPRVSEDDVALAVLRIAAAHPKGICTFHRARSDVPNYLKLSKGDLEPSTTRNGEPMWHQIIRNIQSHHGADGNYINLGYLQHVPRRGYAITPAGRTYLKKLGL